MVPFNLPPDSRCGASLPACGPARAPVCLPHDRPPRTFTFTTGTALMESHPDDWLDELRAGRSDAAWDRFLDRYRRLVFSAIRHYVRDPDDVMDAFAHVCAALHGNDLARLRRYAEAPPPAARFSTWLVTVVRRLTVDWIRRRDGRPRRAAPAGLSPLQRLVYQLVFVDGCSHVESFERLKLSEIPPPSAHEFAEALTETYRLADAAGHAALARRAVADPAVARSPEADLLDAAAFAHVEEALGTLDPADRLAIQLFVVDGVPAADVARMVGWPNAKAVYNHVARSLAAIRRRLGRTGLDRTDF